MTGQASGDPSGSHRHSRSRAIPEATVARLAVYLRVLTNRELVPLGHGAGQHSIVSSAELAAGSGISPAGLRRGFSVLGSHAFRGRGFDVAKLIDEIPQVLGAHQAFR